LTVFNVKYVVEETMSRYERRKAERQSAQITKNAKIDMIKWVETLDHTPTDTETLAWQKGYLAGINRMGLYIEDNA
jgi:hypothetical protein